MFQKKRGTGPRKRKGKQMEKGQNYDANDLVDDIRNNADEVATAVEAILAETRPENFDAAAWEAVAKAAKDARRTLHEIEEMIERKEAEAENYDPEADENRYETWWD